MTEYYSRYLFGSCCGQKIGKIWSSRISHFEADSLSGSTERIDSARVNTDFLPLNDIARGSQHGQVFSRRHLHMRLCQGQQPSISVSSAKLRKVRIRTIMARRPTLDNVSGEVMVPMMSAPTSSSRPSRMPRPRLAR